MSQLFVDDHQTFKYSMSFYLKKVKLPLLLIKCGDLQLLLIFRHYGSMLLNVVGPGTRTEVLTVMERAAVGG